MGELLVEKHVKFIITVEKKKDDFESVVMEHLRLNGAYWGLTTLDILGKLDAVEQDEVISWVMQCQHESGGFGGNIGHDAHVLYTLSAIQVLALFDKLHILDVDKVSSYIAGLQNEDGSFSGDMWGEVDTRFSYISILSLALLHRLDKVDVGKAVKYILSCKNVDGGFGCTPGAESHAGQIFCCVAALALTGSLHHVDKDLLGWWLCERQVKSGGLNGRPEKLPDVCYSWWVLSSLIMIDRVHWIDKGKLIKFILDCQDKENGGISDRPDDAVDVFHTYFGVAGGTGGIAGGVHSTMELPCVAKLMPCQAALASHSTKPPATCCVPLKDIVTKDSECLCNLLGNSEMMKSFNVTKDEALVFAKACGATPDLSLCKNAGSPGSAPSVPSASASNSSSSSNKNASAPAASATTSVASTFGGIVAVASFVSLVMSAS